MAGEIELNDDGTGGDLRESATVGPVEPPTAAAVHACFSSLDLARVRKTLRRIHEQVVNGRGRVEIKRRGTGQICVMISKDELESLESALEILSASADYKSMCATLSEVAAAAGGYPAAQF